MRMMMTTKKKSCVITARLLENRKPQIIKVNVAATAINTNSSSLKKKSENQQVLEKKREKTELASVAATNIGLKKRKDNNDSLQINGDQSCNKKPKYNSTSAHSSEKDFSKKNVVMKGNDDDDKKMRQERKALLEETKKRQLDKQRQASRIALEEVRRKAELEVEDNFKIMKELRMLMFSSSSSSTGKKELHNAERIQQQQQQQQQERVMQLETIKKRQLDKQREASRIALEEVRRKAELEVEDNFKIMRELKILMNSSSAAADLVPSFRHFFKEINQQTEGEFWD